VTEIGYVTALYPHLRFPTWLELLTARIQGELSIVPPFLMLLMPGTWLFLSRITSTTLWFLIASYAYEVLVSWLVQTAIEIMVWTVLLPPLAPHVEPLSKSDRLWLVFMNLPGVHLVLQLISDMLFTSCLAGTRRASRSRAPSSAT